MDIELWKCKASHNLQLWFLAIHLWDMFTRTKSYNLEGGFHPTFRFVTETFFVAFNFYLAFPFNDSRSLQIYLTWFRSNILKHHSIQRYHLVPITNWTPKSDIILTKFFKEKTTQFTAWWYWRQPFPNLTRGMLRATYCHLEIVVRKTQFKVVQLDEILIWKGLFVVTML